MDDPDVSTGREWEHQRPPLLMPVPAAESRPLSGQRVVIHDPEHGIWRYDLRALDEPRPDRGRQVVPVCGEHDWYRAHRDGTAAANWPADLGDVWIEQPVPDADLGAHRPDQSDIAADAGRAQQLIDDLTCPPVRRLRPAVHAAALVGARACVMTPAGPRWGQRVIGAPRRAEYPPEVLNLTRGFDSLGEPVIGTVVPVCPESDFYAWEQLGEFPDPITHATTFVWLE